MEFGEMVSSIVYELTSDGDKVKEMGKANYLLNKMLRMTSYALVIKLADRLHNCSDLANGSQKFRDKYVTETRFILNGLNARYLSDTHKKLMKMIDDEISKFE
jgi:(p)ppGpp synthase/HD superfamily hydrolase